MDDFKRYMKEIAKHTFWIVTVLVLILSSVVFYLTKSSLDDDITKRISSLDSSFNKINEVSGKAATHPNDFSLKEMDKRLGGLKEDVDRAWEFQYERQREFLTWPTESFFQTRTREIFDGLRPFEKNVPFPLPDKVLPPLDSITENDRKVYRGYIAPEFPALARRIGSTWNYDMTEKSVAPEGKVGPLGGGMSPTDMGGFGRTGAASQVSDTRDLVRWSESSQKQLVAAVLPWFSRPTPPTIHEIYYAQEDIWILRGLMDIIAQTNAGANENFQAIVKEIEWIRTGSKASRDAGVLWASGAAGGKGGMGGYPMGGPPSGYTGGGGGGMPANYPTGGMGKGGGGMVRTAVAVDPADGRYVDTNFKPLTGAQLRAAMNLVNATDAVNAVAKRIPVRMRLKVDDRFGRLITECGNGKMVLEVLQVRYNTDPAPDSGGGTTPGLGGGSGGGKNVGMLSGAMGMGMGGGSMEEGSSGGPAVSVTPGAGNGEVSVEIFGLIYLFNPPANLSGTNASATATPSANAAMPAAQPTGAAASDAAANTQPAAVAPPASNNPVETTQPAMAEDSTAGPPNAEAPVEAPKDGAAVPADGAAGDLEPVVGPEGTDESAPASDTPSDVPGSGSGAGGNF